MAARRRTFGRSAFKRRGLETRAHAARVYKRVTRQWQIAFNIKCSIVGAFPGAECPNGTRIIVLSQGQLQGSSAAALGANLSDAVRIKRLEGHLYFSPENSDAGTTVGCTGLVADQSNSIVYMRMGLKKQQAPQSQAGVPDALNPLDNGATPYEISDYADGRWMKMWEHVWAPGGTMGFQALPGKDGCCSVREEYVVPPTAEGTQVTYTVPAIECLRCDGGEPPPDEPHCTFTAEVHRWWHCPIRYGRPIVMKESDDLSLYVGWERLIAFSGGPRQTQPAMKFFGGLRMLLES